MASPEQEDDAAFATYNRVHGGYELSVLQGIDRVYHDGAVCTDHGFFRLYFQPPKDREAFLKVRKRYESAKLARAEEVFNRLRSGMLGQSNELYFQWPKDLGEEPKPADGGLWLRHLQQMVLRHREQLHHIDAELASFPEAIMERERRAEQERVQRENHIAAIMEEQKLRSITI